MVIVPDKIKLSQNYPNPFNPETYITYTIPKAGNVTLTVYNAKGQEVATLIDNEYKNATSDEVKFDGSKLSSGIYIYTLTVDSYKVSKKMVLMK
ncbi:MAG: T9SS type A sorting domain-containing protein [bacterium]